MQRIAMAMAIMILSFSALPIVEASIQINVFNDAYIDDYDQLPTINGIPDQITNNQALFIGNGTLSSGNALEARGIMTFDIAPYSLSSLSSATLSFYGMGNAGQNLSLYIYGGDGLVTLSDYNTSASYINDLAMPIGSVDLVTIDITSDLQSYFFNVNDYAEFRIQSNYTGRFVDAEIKTGEATFPFSIPPGQIGPYLTLDFNNSPTNAVPEPATILLFGCGALGLIRRKLK